MFTLLSWQLAEYLLVWKRLGCRNLVVRALGASWTFSCSVSCVSVVPNNALYPHCQLPRPDQPFVLTAAWVVFLVSMVTPGPTTQLHASESHLWRPHLATGNGQLRLHIPLGVLVRITFVYLCRGFHCTRFPPHPPNATQFQSLPVLSSSIPLPSLPPGPLLPSLSAPSQPITSILFPAPRSHCVLLAGLGLTVLTGLFSISWNSPASAS